MCCFLWPLNEIIVVIIIMVSPHLAFGVGSGCHFEDKKYHCGSAVFIGTQKIDSLFLLFFLLFNYYHFPPLLLLLLWGISCRKSSTIIKCWLTGSFSWAEIFSRNEYLNQFLS